MKIILKKTLLIFFLNLIVSIGFGQNIDLVKVIAGEGIVFNNDSILLGKTDINTTCKILGITGQTNSDSTIMSMWDGYDPETMESTSGSEWIREIKYKNIVFEFASEDEKDNLKLHWIRLGDNKEMKIYTENGLEMGTENPDISILYPRTEKSDYISENKLTYNLYTYGISFQFELLENNNLKLIEISTHYKLK